MKIRFEKYNPIWKLEFSKIKDELADLIGFLHPGFLHPEIEHIGSTSVEGLSAKPIIDVLVGVKKETDLENVIAPLTGKDYIYYEKYNEMMPYRRLFVKHKVNPDTFSLPRVLRNNTDIPASTEEHGARLAHIHILPYNSEHWIRHIAFRDYLRLHAGVRKEYEELKQELSLKEWTDGNEYNGAKDVFIKREEQKAVEWYLKISNSDTTQPV